MINCANDFYLMCNEPINNSMASQAQNNEHVVQFCELVEFYIRFFIYLHLIICFCFCCSFNF